MSRAPRSAPKPTSSERSSSARSAAGFAITAQAAMRVTGLSPGKPPSANTTSLQSQIRLMSMSASCQPFEIVFQHEFGQLGRQRIANEGHRMRFAERKRRVAPQHDLLRRNYLRHITQHRRLEADGIDIKLAQIIADRLVQGTFELSVGIDLALHAGTQSRAKRASVGTDEFERWPAVEKTRTDHFQNVDGAVEQIACDDREFVVARPVLAEGIGRVHEQGNAEIDRGLENRRKPAVIQIKAAHVGGNMAADETMIADTTAQFARGRFRVLHRQQSPAAET